MITRHFIDVTKNGNTRRVHYRMTGNGPPLLMVHQSPRSSKEYESLMQKWSAHFTCIVPDTAGFGQSDPLPGNPEIDEYADATIAFLDALGIKKTAAYGFHSGSIILVTALKRHPERITTLAVGGYAIWSESEMKLFGKSYLPAFHPSDYGEHLTWLWNRILEQSWFFPWFAVNNEHRIPFANDDPMRVDAIVREMLDAGNAYQSGYGAVLRAPRDIPDTDAKVPPCLITAYNGDPLQEHIDRLGDMPNGWSAHKVATPDAHQADSLVHLLKTPTDEFAKLNIVNDEGFVHVRTAGFDGLIHWQGQLGAERLGLHAPGRDASLNTDDKALNFDLPGHGLSDDLHDGATSDDLAEVLAVAYKNLNASGQQIVVGEGASFLLACGLGGKLGLPVGGFNVHLPHPDKAADYAANALPDLTPDRHGHYLNTAWNMVRASHMFAPWFDCRNETAIAFDASDIEPKALAREHLALLNARAGQTVLNILLKLDRDRCMAKAPQIIWMRNADWADARDDIWTPKI